MTLASAPRPSPIQDCTYEPRARSTASEKGNRIAAMNPRTIFQVLEESAAKNGRAVALYQPVQGKGHRTYQKYTWQEYREAALEIAAGLRALGIQKGDIVALDSETRAEFYLADIGVMANGSIAAALYTNYPAEDLLRTIKACGAKALFVEYAKTLGALRDAPVA